MATLQCKNSSVAHTTLRPRSFSILTFLVELCVLVCVCVGRKCCPIFLIKMNTFSPGKVNLLWQICTQLLWDNSVLRDSSLSTNVWSIVLQSNQDIYIRFHPYLVCILTKIKRNNLKSTYSKNTDICMYIYTYTQYWIFKMQIYI